MRSVWKGTRMKNVVGIDNDKKLTRNVIDIDND